MTINVVFTNVTVLLTKVVHFMNAYSAYRFDHIKVCLKYTPKQYFNLK